MDQQSVKSLMNSYCYGPVDLMELHKGDSTMWLGLRDSVGRKARATYRGCVYWRLEGKQKGIHLSQVKKTDADELLRRPGSVTVRALQKNTSNVKKLLQEWQAEGLTLYLHLGTRPDEEFLVVARSLEYREEDEE